MGDGAGVRVPGDKSISHRALILAALANGRSRLRNVLPAEDPRSTAAVLSALGCAVPDPAAVQGAVEIDGVGLAGLRAARDVLDCGNSGTTARLMLGVLAGCAFSATLDGDASLRARPMRRVTRPLERMGATFHEMDEPDRLPVRVTGGALRDLAYDSPHASAQVKSALLLAGLTGHARVRVSEPALSRDHTERMLAAQGARIHTDWSGARPTAWIEPTEQLAPLDLTVPGDPSSAAFLVALALLAPDAAVRVHGVCLNPTRTGLLRVLERMGARIEIDADHEEAGDVAGDILAWHTPLHATTLGAAEVPALIDEIPVLAAVAARADGETRITGASELRVKESDRLATLAANLRAVGVSAHELEDGLVVQGGDAPLRGTVQCHADHRIAMAFGVLAALPGNSITIDQPGAVAVSFPGFWRTLDAVARGHAMP